MKAIKIEFTFMKYEAFEGNKKKVCYKDCKKRENYLHKVEVVA